jgi:hypothetical protein
MSQTYGAAHLKTLDERFYTESKTDIIVNKGIRLDFNGKNSVTIYNVDTVAEGDYVRSGSNRFGALVELGTGVQTFTLSQDKAFTFTVDRGNLEDSMMAQEAAKAVKRQVREVSVPATDVYRLSVLAAYAVAHSQADTGALTTADAFEHVLEQQAEMIDDEVDEEGLVLFVSPTFWHKLLRDPEFKQACDTAYADNKKGIMGEVAGMKVVRCPASYYVANFNFMIVSDKLLVSPMKFNSVRILDEVQGIDGHVAEGRRYYDAFIPTQKGTAVRLHTIS